MNLEISLAPDVIFHIGSLPVTNTLIWSFVVSLFLIFIGLKTARNLKPVPQTMQNIVELVIEEAHAFTDSITNDRKKTDFLFPLVFTMFIFILTANLATFIPGQSAISVQSEGGVIPLFRAVMSDYGMVLALTIITVILVQFVAIFTHGPFAYLKKFINFKSPLKFFLGIMDMIGEVAKGVSLSFRLFGNIFAGEVLTVVILSLLPFLAPLPFLLLGLLTAVVQAFVFSVLTLVFASMASEMEEGA